jgi:hypothetical protein
MSETREETKVNAKTHTLEIAGETIRTRTPRRYIVVAFRGATVYVITSKKDISSRTDVTTSLVEKERIVERCEADGAEYHVGRYVPFAEVRKRTDSFETARRAVRRIANGEGRAVFGAIYDGEAEEWIS